MTFTEAYQVILQNDHARVRRENWSACLGWPDEAPYPSQIQMFWPSGYKHLWQPTLNDIHAGDWVVVQALTSNDPQDLADRVRAELKRALNKATGGA